MAKRKTGTKEWSAKSFNLLTQVGCQANCRYCYAREMAYRYGRITLWQDWSNVKRNPEAWPRTIQAAKRKYPGVVMFPTAHNIDENNVNDCTEVLRVLLNAGNKVVCVMKPTLAIAQQVAHDLAANGLIKAAILFRITITAYDEQLLGFWEPGAPRLGERMAALSYLHGTGYKTSVSVEPALDVQNTPTLFHLVAPFVTQYVWIGPMNKPLTRVLCETSKDADALREMTHDKDERIKLLYQRLKNQPKVRWKETIASLLNLPLQDDNW